MIQTGKHILTLMGLTFLSVSKGEAARNSWYGPSGLMSIPTPEVVREREESLSTWYTFGGGDNHMGLAASFALAPTLEFSFADDINSNRRGGASSILSVKYSPSADFAFGYMHDRQSQYRDILYGVMSAPSRNVYLGAGLTLGSGTRAVLGNYSSNSLSVSRAFAMAGARMDLSSLIPALEGRMEFNGDTTLFGLNWTADNFVDFGLDYMMEDDFTKDDRFVASCNLKF